MPTILIADDQTDVLAALRLLFKNERYEIKTAAAPAEVLDIVNKQELDVVLIDLNYARDTTSGTEGLDLLARIQAVDPLLPVVVMTAWGSVALAVEAMRRGAREGSRGGIVVVSQVRHGEENRHERRRTRSCSP